MSSAQNGGFKNVKGGKFLVLRRDGTIPDWTWFVLGAADRFAPHALAGYRRAIREELLENDINDKPHDEGLAAYAEDISNLANAFDAEREKREAEKRKKGDPEAGPHRIDDALVVKLMTGQKTWQDIVEALTLARRLCFEGSEIRLNSLGDGGRFVDLNHKIFELFKP